MNTFSELQDTKQTVKLTLWLRAHQPGLAQVVVECNETSTEFTVLSDCFYHANISVDKPIRLNLKVLNNIDVEILEFRIDGREVSSTYEFGTDDWGFQIDEPYYQWLHQADGQGWLLKPNN